MNEYDVKRNRRPYTKVQLQLVKLLRHVVHAPDSRTGKVTGTTTGISRILRIKVNQALALGTLGVKDLIELVGIHAVPLQVLN